MAIRYILAEGKTWIVLFEKIYVKNTKVFYFSSIYIHFSTIPIIWAGFSIVISFSQVFFDSFGYL